MPVVELLPIFFIPPFVMDAGKPPLNSFRQDALLKFGEPISWSAFCSQQRYRHITRTPPRHVL
jgi:hypothetical protein